MKIERTKNAARNMVFGTAFRMYQIVLPFFMRTCMIQVMGVEYLGLNGLFVSVLQVLSLAELGVGSAMVYSMYKPIAEDNSGEICALMGLYRSYYRMIGIVIAVIGIAITPLIPKLIQSGLPEGLNIYTLYLLNLAATVLSYWLFAYKNALFQAHQRTDVTYKVLLITNTCQYGAQFLVIFLTGNYYLYLIAALMTQALTNIVTAIAADRIYPNYKPMGFLEKNKVKKINSRIRDLFTGKLGSVVVYSSDTMVISAFLGLTLLAVYQNYYFILSAVMGIVGIGFQACTAGIGNSIIVESREKNYNDLRKFTFLLAWVSGVCTCCFLCLYQPFMRIWAGDKLLLDFSAVICFCIYFLVMELNQLLNTYKDAAGIWHEDRFRPLVTALSNLAMNLIMVQFWGIYGVLLSTVFAAVFVGMPWLLHNLFTLLFDKKQLRDYMRLLLRWIVVVLISCVLCHFFCQTFQLSKWGNLIVRGISCVIIPNILYFIIYRKTLEFRECLILLDRMSKGRLKLEQRLL